MLSENRSLMLLVLLCAALSFVAPAHAVADIEMFFSRHVNPDFYTSSSTPILKDFNLYLADTFYFWIHSFSLKLKPFYKVELALAGLAVLIMSILYRNYLSILDPQASHVAMQPLPKVFKTLQLLKWFFGPLVSLALWQVFAHIVLQIVVAFLPSSNHDQYVQNSVKMFNLLMPLSSTLPYMCSKAYEIYYDDYLNSPSLVLSFALGLIFWFARRSIRNLSLSGTSSIDCLTNYFYYFYIYFLTFIFVISHKRYQAIGAALHSHQIFYGISFLTLLLAGKHIFDNFSGIDGLLLQLVDYIRIDYLYSAGFIYLFSGEKLARLLAPIFNLKGFALSPLECLESTSFSYFFYYIIKVAANSF